MKTQDVTDWFALTDVGCIYRSWLLFSNIILIDDYKGHHSYPHILKEDVKIGDVSEYYINPIIAYDFPDGLTIGMLKKEIDE